MDRVEIITRAICKSRKFECGQGTCALICMDQLGDVRAHGCRHHQRLHAELATQIVDALDAGGV